MRGDLKLMKVFCGGVDRDYSTWEDRKGDPRIGVGSCVRLCIHRKVEGHKTNSFDSRRMALVGSIAKVVGNEGYQRPSGLGYLRVRVKDHPTYWWRCRDVVLQKRSDDFGSWEDDVKPADIRYDITVKSSRVNEITREAEGTVLFRGCRIIMDELLDSHAGIDLQQCVLETNSDSPNGFWTVVESRREGMKEVRAESRESDWLNVLRPAIGALNRNNLIDLCLEITKDANMPGVDKADLFERTKNRDLINGLKERHFNFKNIMGPFRTWQEKRFKELGKTGYDFETSYVNTPAAMADAAAMANGEGWNRFHSSGTIQDCSILKDRDESPDEYMHKLAKYGKVSDQTIAEIGLASIRAQLDKGQTPAYREADEMTKTAVDIRPIGLSEVRAKTPSFQEEKETAQAINKSMARHQKTAAQQIMDQMQEYHKRLLSTQMHAELFGMPSNVTVDFIRAEERVLSQLKERGFPTEPIPEPKLTAPSHSKRWNVGDQIDYMTDNDLRGKVRLESKEREALLIFSQSVEGKKDRIATLQAEIEEGERKNVVGSPSDLTNWLQKPLGSF